MLIIWPNDHTFPTRVCFGSFTILSLQRCDIEEIEVSFSAFSWRDIYLWILDHVTSEFDNLITKNETPVRVIFSKYYNIIVTTLQYWRDQYSSIVLCTYRIWRNIYLQILDRVTWEFIRLITKRKIKLLLKFVSVMLQCYCCNVAIFERLKYRTLHSLHLTQHLLTNSRPRHVKIHLFDNETVNTMRIKLLPQRAIFPFSTDLRS